VPLEDLTLEFAEQLLSLPREIGPHPETGKPITASIGRYGPYLAHDGKYAKLSSTAEVFETGMNAAVAKLADAALGNSRRQGASREPLAVLGKHPASGQEIKLMAGRYGPYVTDGSTNATLPKGTDPKALSFDEAVRLIDERAAKGPPKKKGRRNTRKKAK
jgi:DNA topoisomerase-1